MITARGINHVQARMPVIVIIAHSHRRPEERHQVLPGEFQRVLGSLDRLAWTKGRSRCGGEREAELLGDLRKSGSFQGYPRGGLLERTCRHQNDSVLARLQSHFYG